jgi:hypothetical protein
VPETLVVLGAHARDFWNNADLLGRDAEPWSITSITM